MPSLLVVVPVRDGAATLAGCLAALIAALPPGAAAVVVDDGSRDETAAIARRFPVRLVQLPSSRGASGARNAGWRSEPAPLVAFVDADVALRPDALSRLVAALDATPDALGANGLLALDLPVPGVMSAFANTSIHYQHLCHGRRVATAFTSVCVLRREALLKMGGWDEDTSRYADDVATRWHLPADAILLVPEAQAAHHKAVSFSGLLKHRFNIGYFFVGSVLAHRQEARARPKGTVLAPRYPLNTLAAALTCACGPLALVAGPWPLLLPAGIFLAANLRFTLFTLRHRGLAEALVATPISALEGFAYMSGMGWSATVHARRSRGRATTAPGSVRPPLREGGAGEPPPHP